MQVWAAAQPQEIFVAIIGKAELFRK